ncbi:Mfa1 family fimbria major subunit [Parabacteroides sp.]
MKLRTIFMSMLAIAALTSCNNDDDDHRSGSPQIADTNVAYLSIKIETQPTTRSSSENAGTGESDLKTLYLITFDENENVVGVPGTNTYFTKLNSSSSVLTSPDPVRISGDAEKMLLIANPGSKLESTINSIGVTSTFSSINAAIIGATKDEVTDNDTNTKGFTMINSGDESKAENNKLTNLLIDISTKIKKVGNGVTEDAAKTAAEGDRVNIQIERLAAKIELKLKDNLETKPSGADFTFAGWTLDAVNSTFYPCAEKTLLGSTHTPGSYTYNFYTHDPNFTGANGLDFTTLSEYYTPVLPQSYTWMTAPSTSYCIENTMEKDHQLFGNATRLVISGAYYPAEYDGEEGGDWFNYAGKNYHSLAALQEAYDAAEDGSNLKAACNDMFTKIKEYATKYPSAGINPPAEFRALTKDHLEKVPNGGELIREGDKNVIRWYQRGLCYYYYIFRHDNEANEEMEFGKYGVVRNNWYSLTLGSVNGPGTPWYPDPNNPGPGDPDPKDPIDEAAGYLGITVSTAPWVIWENEISI